MKSFEIWLILKKKQIKDTSNTSHIQTYTSLQYLQFRQLADELRNKQREIMSYVFSPKQQQNQQQHEQQNQQHKQQHKQQQNQQQKPTTTITTITTKPTTTITT